MKGCDVSVISYAFDGSNINAGAPGDGSCSVYHQNGGGLGNECEADCSGGFTEGVGKCHLFVSSSLNYASAQEACEGQNANLASVHSQAEQDFLVTLTGGVDFYIGYTDVDNEGTWVWADGTPTTYTGWNNISFIEPNGSTSENCAGGNWGGDQRWHDTSCNGTRRYVCQRLPGIN